MRVAIYIVFALVLLPTTAAADMIPLRPSVGEKPFGYLRQPAAGDRTFVTCPTDQRTVGYVTSSGTFTIDGRRLADAPLPSLLFDLCKPNHRP